MCWIFLNYYYYVYDCDGYDKVQFLSLKFDCIKNEFLLNLSFSFCLATESPTSAFSGTEGLPGYESLNMKMRESYTSKLTFDLGGLFLSAVPSINLTPGDSVVLHSLPPNQVYSHYLFCLPSANMADAFSLALFFLVASTATPKETCPQHELLTTQACIFSVACKSFLVEL